MRFDGILIGLVAMAIIGILHPVIIKSEYHFGIKVWPAFLITGVISIILSVFCSNSIVSSILAVLGFSLLWSIHELFQQKERVEKGWFPRKEQRTKK